jgi:two-component system KDP operon response regulator KdpE
MRFHHNAITRPGDNFVSMSPDTQCILIVEDESAIRNILRANLVGEGYRVIEAGTGAEADVQARSQRPDLVLVDLGLPDVDGLTVIRTIRTWSFMPIIVLSARTSEEAKVAALDAGADDYITKPFSAPELLARVRAGLRRVADQSKQSIVLQLGPVQVNLAAQTSRGPHGSINLTPQEYRVLDCLGRRAGLLVLQRELLREVWGPDRSQDSRNLRTCIKNLRNKLEPDPAKPSYLVTEVGLGYRLRAEVVATTARIPVS